jgi:hypothetical protein
MIQAKTFVTPLQDNEQLPAFLEALHLLQRFTYWHHMATTYHGSKNHIAVKHWHNKANEFLNKHTIQTTQIMTELLYSVHNVTHNTYLTKCPTGIIGKYIFTDDRSQIAWFDNQLYTEVIVQKYNDGYHDQVFKLINNGDY